MTLEAVPAHVRDWIEVSDSGTTLVVRICGELDADSVKSFGPAIMAAIASGGSVIIDLGELTFCDSHGIAMFVEARERARAEGRSLAIRNLLPPVQRLFAVTGLDAVFDLID